MSNHSPLLKRMLYNKNKLINYIFKILFVSSYKQNVKSL